jgi:D-aminopeptidase
LSIEFRVLLSILIILPAIAVSVAHADPRARDLGVPFEGSPGPLNAITDVAGVTVGQVTLIEDLADGRKVRTGVTAILPRGLASAPCTRRRSPGA